MVTKGIITSIDFNGNTCQVRIPFFETAGNDPIIGTAIVSNTPGSYNGYKAGDVVLVAFEDGQMETPVVIGKLYLGAEKEKADPRGSLNTESLVAAKTAAVPADTKLTTDTDKNLPNTMNPYANLSSIANNLNKLNTDVNYLDAFTNNQFSSVITDVNKQGDELRSEIKQTAENIENKVVHKHQDGSQDALGWNLDEKEWKINAQDTVNGVVKDINIVTIDRSGMSIAGDLKLNGYPKNIIVKYAQNDSDTTHPALDSTEWSTNVPARVDGQYIWQWTHTESFLFDKNTNSWNEQDDDKIVCITGADGKDGAPGKDGYNTVTVMLYKRSTTSISGEQISTDLYYKFSDQKLYTDEGCADEYILPTGWSYTISGAGDSGDGDLYCIAAVANSNTDSDSIPASEWVGPTLYVKNGEPTVTLSIENDFDSIPCDYYGNPSYSKKEWETKTSHTIKVLEGQVQQQFSVIADSSDKQIPSTGYAVVYKPDDFKYYVVDTTDPILSIFTAHITGLTTDSANVLYTLYKNGIAIDEARFTATKLKAGAPGDPAVDYDILFSSGTIKVPKTGDKNPRTISVNFKKTVGQAKPVDFSGKYKVFIDNTETYSNFESEDVSSITLAAHDAAGEELDISSAKSNVTVELFANYNADSWIKVDGETIDVVADGTDGTSVAQLILYKRTTETISSPADDGTWTYNAADGSLTCSDKSTEWKTGIPSGTAPCYESHAAVLVTGLGTINIEDEKWSEPAKFVENGADGKPGASTYTISIDNDFDSVPADVNGNVSSSYPWETETKHNVRVYYGKESQDFTIMDQNGTVSETGLCLKYKLTNVTLENITPDPGVSSKVATARINDLSADTGNILYTLYVDGVETGITGKFSATKIKSPAPTYTISIDNDFATIPTSIVNNKIYRNANNKFVPAANGYSRKTITVAGTTKKLPGMKLSAVKTTTKLKDALLQKPVELITGTEKSYVEDITKHNVTVYCNDDVETITADNFIVKLDSDGLDANMDETQNYLVCELGGFDSTGARATDFPGMNPAVNNNVVTNYITALSALGDTSESKSVYIQYTYYVKGEPVATAKFEVTRHTGPTTYYLSSNVSTIKINKNVSPATITPDKVICTAYSLDTSTNTNTKFTNGTWKYKWDNGTWSPDTSTASDLKISTADVIKNSYKKLYIELYLDNQLWDRETIDVIADGENAVDYRIIASSGTIKVTKTGNKDPQFITVDFKQINGSATPAAFSGNYKVFIDNGTEPTSYGTADSIVLATSGATSQQIDISSATSRVTVDLYTTDGSTKLESETIDVVADGADGQPGVYIKEVKQWYILWPAGAAATDKPSKPGSTEKPEPDEPENTAALKEWMSTPPEAVNGYVVWTCHESIFSDDTPEKRHIKFSDPVKDNAYALAQGKTTNYYSPTEPVNKIKIGDCWFDTGYVNVGTFGTKADYLGKFVISTAGDILVEQDENDSTRYIPNAAGSTRLIKITPENIDTLIKNKTIVVDTTEAFETGNLKQCSGFNEDTKKAIWEDIAGELVTNKLTANYINALDITAQGLRVVDEHKNLILSANIADDDTKNKVKIGGFSLSTNEFKTTRTEGTGDKSWDAADVLITNADQTYKSKVANKDGTDWRLLVGEHFGVNSAGGLCCDKADVKGSIIATSGRLENIDIIKSDYLASTQIQATDLNTNNLKVANEASIAGFKLKSATTESATTASKEVSLKIITPTGPEYVDSIGTYIGGSWLFKLTFACYDGDVQQSFINQHNFTNYKIYSATFESDEKKTVGTGSDTSTTHYLTKIYFNNISLTAYKGQSTITATVSGGSGGASRSSKWKLKEVAIYVNENLKNLSYFNGGSDSAKVTIDYLTTVNKSNLLLDGGISINGDLIPYNDNWSIGDSSHKWNTLYVNNAYATAFYASSDKRLKENIKEFEPKNSILNLPVVEFDFKNSNIHQIGCIAQDLQKICPELVTTNADGYLSISENKLSYLLLLELKKLNNRVIELEQKLIEKDTNK